MKSEPKKHTATMIGAVIVGLWLALIGYYVVRQFLVVSAPSAAMGGEMKPGDKEVWMGLYLGQKKIGYNRMALRSTGTEMQVLDEVMFNIKLMNQSQKVHMRVKAALNPDYTLKTFQIEGLEGIANISASGEVRGNSIVIKARLADEQVADQVIAVSQPPLLYSIWLVSDRLRAKGLKVGEVLNIPVFEPTIRSVFPVTLTVEAEESVDIHGQTRQAFKVKENLAGQEDYLWISPEGELLKQAHPAGFIVLAETKDQAVSGGWDNDGAVDLIAALVVKSNTAIIEPRKVSLLRARLKNISLNNLDLNDDRQAAEGDLVIVRREENIPALGYELPLGREILARHPELNKYLEAEPTVQKDDPKIKAAALKAASGKRDAVSAAQALTGWVSNYVEDAMVMTLPNARSVLEQKKGACKEHTVLYTALARAIGIPARMNAGIVYTDAGQVIEGFYYHAWPEVWLAGPEGENGRWVAVDPTFNQFPADATHIRLKEGGVEKVLDLLGVVGQVEVEIEEYR